jgi:hypothetical protein
MASLPSTSFIGKGKGEVPLPKLRTLLGFGIEIQKIQDFYVNRLGFLLSGLVHLGIVRSAAPNSRTLK